MVQFLDSVVIVVVGLLALLAWRWLWIRNERRRILEKAPMHEDERFECDADDEAEQFFFGRIIRRLRARVIGGRVEIKWQYHPEFIHRGFALTGKCRRNDGTWEPLAFEPHYDSGSWNECFNLGESRSYLFTVKKTYRFFFGLFPGDEVDNVFDQISFSVRKGKYLKEVKEIAKDRNDLIAEGTRGLQLKREFFKERTKLYEGERPTRSRIDERVANLTKEVDDDAALDDFLEKRFREINEHPTWSPERKAQEKERAQMKVEETRLRETE